MKIPKKAVVSLAVGVGVFVLLTALPNWKGSIWYDKSTIPPLRTAESVESVKQDLQTYIPATMKKQNIQGLSIALIRDGQVVYRDSFGSRNGETDLTPEMKMEAASISKVLTATAAMRLVEQGKLELDKPVNDYLSGWHVPDDAYGQKVTLRSLLSHTSGTTVHGWLGNDPDQPARSLVDQLTQEVRVEREPGTGYQYSGGGYLLIGKLIEDATGKPFADYMQQEILAPLGMKSSTFRWTPSLQAEKAPGHYFWYPLATPVKVFHNEAPAAGLVTTVDDLATLMQSYMNGGEWQGFRLLQPESIAEMRKLNAEFEPNSGMLPGDHPTGVGLGWMLENTPNGQVLQHDGSNYGYSSSILFYPDQKTGVAVLTNTWLVNTLVHEIAARAVGGTGAEYAPGTKTPVRYGAIGGVSIALITWLLCFGIDKLVHALRSRRNKAPTAAI